MTEQGQVSPSKELREAVDQTPHLGGYLESFANENGEYPILVETESVGEYERDYPNLIYNVDDDGMVYIHIYGDKGSPTSYEIVEPVVQDEKLYSRVQDLILRLSSDHEAPDENTFSSMENHVDNLLDDAISSESESNFFDTITSRVGNRIIVPDDKFSRIEYTINRDIAGVSELQPLMLDPYNEDIHVIGANGCHVDHGVFGLLETNVDFGSSDSFDRYLKNLGERINSPISDSNPIVDATMPDGSRLNVIYSDDVSVQGPSMTIRQGDEVPLTILQITKWGTLSPKMAAYLWLCLENKRTVFVVGETASGKTTTLNSLLSFINNDSKIYTAEDTAEVLPPQNAWQQLLTRETPDENSTDVTMFDLVASALRSRPDYIVVGEVRGEEAQMAFQAAQTGHPVLLTFHAGSVETMIQRFTSNPINIPKSFMPTADVALFQNRVKRGDGEILRRVTSVSEIVEYNDREDGVVTQDVFKWDAAKDEHRFTGSNSSSVLEEDIAELLGYADTKKIYDELERREDIIKRLIDSNILEYEEVNNTIQKIQNDGVQSLHIDTTGLTKSVENYG